MDDLLCDFLTETGESIAVLDIGLVNLEKTPNDPALISEIFRVVHTIKGTCGFLGLPRLESVAHAAEEVLGKFRSGDLTVSQDSVTLILESIDSIKDILSVIEQTEAEPPGDDQALIDRLNAVAEGVDALGEPSAQSLSVEFEPVAASAESQPAVEAETLPETPVAPETGESEPVSAGTADAEASPAEATETPPAEAAETPPAEAAEPTPAETPPADAGTAATAKPAASAAAAQKSSTPKAGESSLANQNIRVGVDLLEHLMTMVSELVLTRNQLLQMVRGQTDNEFAAPLQRLSHVTTELQEGVMKTRMQPIGNAWAKLPRIVRDLCVELGKNIELKMIGADTELDRQVLELIKDPLTHMVRNSADHGIEMPDVRDAAGKPKIGELVLKAYHEGGHIVIEISDDGKGVDPEKIKNKAIENGLVTETEAEAMSDKQILQFLFKPGFSTAEKVTSVSGRGVGMDVVKTNVEKIGGTVELHSDFGKGSTVTIKIPLTLAIVSALIVECCGQRFAIPQISVVELVRASANSEHTNTIEVINGTPVLRLRDRLLPLLSLAQTLKLGDGENAISADTETFIIVSQVGAHSFGLIVDKVFDAEEIVVKPVTPLLREVGVFSGNTILGDGSIVMILDLNGIAATTSQAGIASDSHSATEATRAVQKDETVALIVFRAGGTTPCAVPLALVARLEEIDYSNIEYSDGQPVVQYRGQLMPLISASNENSISCEGKTPVIVFSDLDRSMGLVVDEIVDIVEDKLNIELAGKRAGVIGSAVVAGQATDIVDAGYYLSQAFSDWFADTNETRGGNASTRLLLVDDSPFFRNLLAPLLSASGYAVTMAEDASKALELLETGGAFDIIVSDIEMPGMDGYDFAKACRSDSRWSETPIVALTSHTSPEDLKRGREAGFTDYVGKLDREALLAALSQSLSLTGEAA